jgi:hypothetical protein
MPSRAGRSKRGSGRITTTAIVHVMGRLGEEVYLYLSNGSVHREAKMSARDIK